jgi:hypothetical protein
VDGIDTIGRTLTGRIAVFQTLYQISLHSSASSPSPVVVVADGRV